MMKKILFVIPTLAGGGAERVVSLLSQEYERLGYQVKIILFSDNIYYSYGGTVVTDISAAGSDNYLVKLWRLYIRWAGLMRIFKKEQADYIFSFMEGCNFTSILTGFKVVVSVHSNPLVNHLWYQRVIMRLLYNFSNVNKVIAVSQGLENILNKRFNIHNTQTIYNPIMLPKTTQNKTRDNYLLAVGRLHYSKNYALLIKAFAKSKASAKTTLRIAGDGEDKQKIIALIKALGISDKVELLGLVKDIESHYQQADMYILSSRYEGFSNTLHEALANNCACIATDCPVGPGEIIHNNQNGLLVESENQQALTNAIDRLYFDENLKQKFRNNAQSSVKHLNVENIAKQWL